MIANRAVRDQVAATLVDQLYAYVVGRYVVGHLVKTESVRPAAAATYAILTDLLRGAGWTAIIVAVVALAGIWLSGPRPQATAARRGLAPYLRRPEVAYGTLVIGYLLLLWWRPTPQFGFPLTVVVWFGLALLGLEALRRRRRSAPSVREWRRAVERTAPRASSSGWRNFVARAFSTRPSSRPPRPSCSVYRSGPAPRDPAGQSRSL